MFPLWTLLSLSLFTATINNSAGSDHSTARTPTYFRHHGTLATSVSYAHITFDLHLSPVLHTIRSYCVHQAAVLAGHKQWTPGWADRVAFRPEQLIAPSYLPHIQKLQAHNCERLLDDYTDAVSLWYPYHNMYTPAFRQQINHTAQLWIDHWDTRRANHHSQTVDPELKQQATNNTLPAYLLNAHHLRTTINHTAVHDLYLSNPHLSRQKRGILSSLFSFGIGFLFSGLFPDQKVTEISTRQDHLIKALQVQDARINNLQKANDLLTNSLITINNNLDFLTSEQLLFQAIYAQDIAERDIRLAINSIASIAQNKLSPNLVPPHQLDHALQDLELQLQDHDISLFSRDVFNVYQSEITHIGFLNNTIRAIAHLPCYSSDNLLTLLEYLPLPTLLSNNSGRVIYTSPDLKNEILAITEELDSIEAYTTYYQPNSNLYYRSFPASYLTSCNKHGDYYYCPNLNYMDKRVNSSCLYALYKNNPEAITELCHFILNPLDDYLVQLNTTAFILYHASFQTITFKCNNLTHYFAFAGLRLLTAKPGCIIHTPSFKISTQDDTWLTPRTIQGPHIDFINITTMATLSALHSISNESFQHLQALSTSQGTLLKHFNAQIQQASVYKTHWWTSISTAVIVAIIVAFVVLILLYNCCYRNSLSTLPTHSTTIVNPTSQSAHTPSNNPVEPALYPTIQPTDHTTATAATASIPPPRNKRARRAEDITMHSFLNRVSYPFRFR